MRREIREDQRDCRFEPSRHGLVRGARQGSRGFTLIEILLVVIIIGILVSLVAPRLS